MGYPTGIEWTDATFNPIGGCLIKSPGCINCYAQSLAGTRLINHLLYKGTTDLVKGKPVFNGTMTVIPDNDPRWNWPLKWRGAKHPVMGEGMPSLIFVGDMSDLFHENRPDEQIDKVFAVMALCPQHTFQVLTKRPKRMREYILGMNARHTPDGNMHLSPATNLALAAMAFNQEDAICRARVQWPLPNVWLGTSVERQQEADERIPLLLQTPAAVRFISAEPLLGPIDLTRIRMPQDENRECSALDGHEIAGMVGNCVGYIPPLDWIICGGESGPDRRPTDIAWMHSLRDQCLAAGVPYFHKQMTGKKAIPPDLRIRQFPATKPLAVAAATARALESRRLI